MSKNNLFNKKYLITGGTGSFGKHITKHLLKWNAREVIVFSRDEDKQYSMQFEFQKYSDRLRFYIGDIRDKDSLKKATRDVDIVLHAAALKQIPSTEYNPEEAVRTNILGAQNVVDACVENNVEKAIAISTDKAVEPINTMGLTKALQEKIFILGNKQKGFSKTAFSLVRYGNVVASRGSVIPQFKKQIVAGGPISITHKEMTRFILTLDEAIALISTALKVMKGGEVFVPKIKAIKILDLAKYMIETMKPQNKKIIYTGIRPGEKMHEVLISDMESLRVIEKKNYVVIMPHIDLKEVGHTYKVRPYKEDKIKRFSSNNVPYYSKSEIKQILEKEGIFQL